MFVILVGSIEMYMLYSIRIYREGSRKRTKPLVAFSNDGKCV